MDASFYWYAWMNVIILYFFVKRNSYRDTILLFVGLTMCMYAIFRNGTITGIYVQIIFLLLYGIYFWSKGYKPLWNHGWPFIVSLLYSAFQLFFIIHPVWTEFPGLSLGWISVLYILYLCLRDFEETLGIWLIMNSLGMLWSTLVLTVYAHPLIMETFTIMLLSIKGLFILFIVHGIGFLKSWVRRNLQNQKQVHMNHK